MKKTRHFGFVREEDIHYKLHYIARFEGRSAKGLLVYLINKCIRAFEDEYGPISMPKGEEDDRH